MKSLKAKFRKSDTHEWSKNDERLLAAVEHGEADKVASLLSKKGTSGIKLDSEGKSALHVAAMRGQVECLAAILSHCTDPTITDSSGFSALHLAAKNGHVECARKLIQTKCAVDTLDSSGRTALHHAATSGNVALVQLLCENKCPINLRDQEGYTSLHLAVRHVNADVCLGLLDLGADPNIRDNSGRTAVMLASESSNLASVESLLHRGADLQLVDSLGHDVLHYAIVSGNQEVQAILLSALEQLKTDTETQLPKQLQHDQVASLVEDRTTTPKKRKAPPPPVSPLQSPEIASPPYLTPDQTPLSGKEILSRFNYQQEEELRVQELKDEIENLQEEKDLLLTTIKDLKHTVSQSQTQVEHGPGESDAPTAATVAALEAKVHSLSLENQQLAQILKKRMQSDGTKEGSRPNSMDSNTSYHSTHAELDQLPLGRAQEQPNPAEPKEEVQRLQEALQSLRMELHELQKENLTLQARPVPHPDSTERLLVAQEEIRMLQEALQGTVPVEAAARDFEEMKSELSGVIEGLQNRLVELSHSYSEAKSELNAAQAHLEPPVADHRVEEMARELEKAQEDITQAEIKLQATVEELETLRMEARNFVTLPDHTHVVSSLSKAIKELESQVEGLKEELSQKVRQMKGLEEELAQKAQKVKALEEEVSQNTQQVEGQELELTKKVQEVEDLKTQLETTIQDQPALQTEVERLKALLQEALRKQDELALEAAAAWQEVREGQEERQALQGRASAREQENNFMTSQYKESQDMVLEMKNQVENLLSSEREKNKKIEEMTKEVSKLKEALNSLSQLSYPASAPKRQNLQLDSLQQQVKQLQYQLAESKKQHNEIVSVYRMHLLYAVQGQMDEDVQQALKQILLMCKMPSDSK